LVSSRETHVAQPHEVPFDADMEANVLGAALVDRTVRQTLLAELTGDHFHIPEHREVFAAIRDVEQRGGQVDEITVRAELDRRRKCDRPAAYIVSDLLAQVGIPRAALAYIPLLIDKRARRQLLTLITEQRKIATDGASLERLPEIADAIRSLVVTTSTLDALELADIDDFLKDDETEFDWLVEGVLERRDRLILTGEEGGGKSTLLAQIAVQVAGGIHPFDDSIEQRPARVLFVDLENGDRELRRRLRALRLKAGDRLEPGMLFPVSRPEGISLTTEAEDRDWFRQRVAVSRAELVVAGPIYKMSDGDPSSEQDSKPVAAFLDTLRAEFGCAVILEAHMPHERKKGRPFGWSGWRRWPEIGLELTSGDFLKPWRPARHETPGIPPALKRAGEWPFTVVTRPRDVLWARIETECGERLERPSIRELAAALDAKTTTIQRTIEEHREQWEAMGDE
jgi:hypothetical protein